jgi:hypothetical protein
MNVADSDSVLRTHALRAWTYCYWTGGRFEQWRTCTVFGDIIRLSAGE